MAEMLKTAMAGRSDRKKCKNGIMCFPAAGSCAEITCTCGDGWCRRLWAAGSAQPGQSSHLELQPGAETSLLDFTQTRLRVLA